MIFVLEDESAPGITIVRCKQSFHKVLAPQLQGS